MLKAPPIAMHAQASSLQKAPPPNKHIPAAAATKHAMYTLLTTPTSPHESRDPARSRREVAQSVHSQHHSGPFAQPKQFAHSRLSAQPEHTSA